MESSIPSSLNEVLGECYTIFWLQGEVVFHNERRIILISFRRRDGHREIRVAKEKNN